MLGRLTDAPEWATHYVERIGKWYWFVSFDTYRWTKYRYPDEEFMGESAENFVNLDIKANPEAFLVVELNYSLENE